jgi:2-polyprenyl-3-methyl-5-hydroxy-6-metoxy-1,4-benzoquinol methylase
MVVRPLHQINPLRLDWIRQIAPHGAMYSTWDAAAVFWRTLWLVRASVLSIDLATKALKVAELPRHWKRIRKAFSIARSVLRHAGSTGHF